MFLLNSCLDLFSAPHLTGDPFSRSYRVNLPSSLTVNLSSALVYSTRLRVSVWSTGGIRICLADFLGSLLTTAIRLPGGSRYCQFRHTTRICLGHVYLRQQAGVSLLRLHVAPYTSNGILTVSSIGCAVRLRLRSRLTLIRLALIRNP